MRNKTNMVYVKSSEYSRHLEIMAEEYGCEKIIETHEISHGSIFSKKYYMKMPNYISKNDFIKMAWMVNIKNYYGKDFSIKDKFTIRFKNSPHFTELGNTLEKLNIFPKKMFIEYHNAYDDINKVDDEAVFIRFKTLQEKNQFLLAWGDS